MAEKRFNKTIVRSLIGGALIIFAGILLSKRLSSGGPEKSINISFRNKLVAVQEVKTHEIPLKIHVNGRLKALNRMEIYPEVNGILLSTSFREGASFGAGDIIARLDSKEFELQLQSQKSSLISLLAQSLPDMAVDYPDAYSSWKSFAASIRSDASLPSLPTIANDQLRQYLSVRNILPSYYNIQSQEERLKKYVIKAPYSGILSEAMVDPGTMVRAGQKIGTYVNRAAYELEASLSLNDLNYLKTGSKVRLYTEQKDQSYIGTLSRVNTVVDPLTQMVSAFLRVEGQELREGLYLQAEILGGMAENAYEVKRQMLQGTQLYLVGRDSSLYLKEVEIISFNGENAIIRGLESGDMMPVRMVPGAFEGLKVIPEIQNDSKKGA